MIEAAVLRAPVQFLRQRVRVLLALTRLNVRGSTIIVDRRDVVAVSKFMRRAVRGRSSTERDGILNDALCGSRAAPTRCAHREKWCGVLRSAPIWPSNAAKSPVTAPHRTEMLRSS